MLSNAQLRSLPSGWHVLRRVGKKHCGPRWMRCSALPSCAPMRPTLAIYVTSSGHGRWAALAFRFLQSTRSKEDPPLLLPRSRSIPRRTPTLQLMRERLCSVTHTTLTVVFVSTRAVW